MTHMDELSQFSRAPMLVFISHNKADKEIARSLAQALTDQGIGVWFDEWNLKPGDSITGGVQEGLSAADLAMLIWSQNAAQSRWVKEELQALIYRRISDGSVKLAPVLLDETPLPPLLADSFGFRLSNPKDVLDIAAKVGGDSTAVQLAQRLQERFFEMLGLIGEGVHFYDYRFCPMCGSKSLESWEDTDHAIDQRYAVIRCKDCKWEEADEL